MPGAVSRRGLLTTGVAAALAARGAAHAQGFPSGPVKIVIATGAGGSPDVLTRIVADHLTKLWKQQVVVINQPGGGGAVAIRALAAMPPDGHTLYMSLATNYIALPELQASFPVDVVRDFVPIGFVGAHPMIVAVSPKLGVSTLPELIALAKKRKGELNVSAGNRGSILHLTAEWLRSAAGIDVVLMHYTGASHALTDIMAGRVHAIVDPLTSVRGAVDSGKLKPLAIATRTRSAAMPNLPTVAETIPGFEAVGWLALMAPPGTPAAIADRISADLRAVLARPELRGRFEDLGTRIVPTTPAELTDYIREQQRIWRPVIAVTAKSIK